jgi:hypothetical protein
LEPLDPLTGPDPSTLNIGQLTERLAMERALREQEFRALREALEAVKDAIKAQASADQRALELQATEYERRLETLNHAHQQAVEAQARTVPRELFDQYVKETAARESALVNAQSDRFNVAVEAINARVDELMNWRSGLEGRLIGVSAVIGVIVVIVNIAIRIL